MKNIIKLSLSCIVTLLCLSITSYIHTEDLSDKSPIVKIVKADTLNISGYSDTSTTLTEPMKKQLEQVILYLKANENLNIRVDGHSDKTDSFSFDMDRSRQRALAVNNYLREQGIDQNRIRFQGRGNTTPLVPNSNDENKAKNRRISIIILADDDKDK